MTEQKAREIAKAFRQWVLDSHGNINRDLIDYAWETEEDEDGYYIRLYVDYDTDRTGKKYIDTFVEVRKGEDCIQSSSCYGWSENNITNEIVTVYGWCK